ncbi:MCM16 (YPR046W) [Zygosaccharomyces parabailii]|uniref:ZYBA0S06-04786g1_1 n=1 Tax=Zygosaccharomyces bailii (strain CLIB 213 / ATCC 58445 / CBS 680 / BCRC 21525 / NBRC 1098 / NCYC 1416 / NRRL Y-2227) TaxID=1333698 RepID=A0A8J2T7E9_ZYGB2|nr:MCM16 (YPR046W) [Zygosaccharomyces parabailii]CDF90274.1 ZYBA0S06-04786g1_1 [Zygosaccharomyces bailii CLIB 213]CDH16506.1 uncharacterized protein ZBAI_08294 [Zygosaccharomyces bailii ISA1307]
MERVVELEKQHVLMHGELLKALDELYLLQQGAKLDREKERTAQVRRQLQMSLEKSAAILRALDRLGHEQRISEPLSENSTERLLANRLRNLMNENYRLDGNVNEILTKQTELSEELRKKRSYYWSLVDRLKRLSADIDIQEPTAKGEELQEPTTSDGTELEKENETIEQLLIALKVHGGYDPFI